MISKKYAPIVLLSTSLMAAIPAHADSSTTSKVGDVLAFAIPTAAYGSTYYMDDKEGRQQFYYSFATNVATTQVLKSVIDKERPNGRDEDSFPSGHTSMAFQGASFIHKRYGLEYSIPAYIGAGFVAYSRVEADEHDVADVVAGAALGIASSMYLTKSYYDDQVHIATNLAPDYYGVSVHYNF
ncbi:phosphatase PAP2 family protein [uncultured Psychrobacter sp.]|uniref:phosphatase PAP2 family protein n=1 Tax=uncultured Psychrobacter sp. TaxID=259303 RepID=UPI0025955F97|nr:phosphatase PAP2 family protein [uncultured Psychrobacter sp.]